MQSVGVELRDWFPTAEWLSSSGVHKAIAHVSHAFMPVDGGLSSEEGRGMQAMQAALADVIRGDGELHAAAAAAARVSGSSRSGAGDSSSSSGGEGSGGGGQAAPGAGGRMLVFAQDVDAAQGLAAGLKDLGVKVGGPAGARHARGAMPLQCLRPRWYSAVPLTTPQ